MISVLVQGGGRRKSKGLYTSMFIVRINHCPVCLHFVLFSCVYSVYKGQMSPNLQHLVFLDV